MGLGQLRRNNKEFMATVIAKTQKIEKAKTTKRKGSGTLYEQIKELCELVESKLGHLRDTQICIQDEEELNRYIDHAIQNGFISLDTETTGLDPITDKIVGACIYTPGEKTAYIPINHTSLITGVRLNNQLTNEQVAKAFKKLQENNVKIIYFNAKFDIRVCRHQLGVDLPPYWDGFIASKCLKEDEEEGNLKYLWTKYCSNNKEAEHFTFEKLFKNYTFNLIPIETACLYAANDAIITWELFKFQEPYLTEDNQKCIECGLQRVANLYHNIEMPIIMAVAEIEDNGVSIDLDYIKELSEKYHKKLQEKSENFFRELESYKDQITQYRATHINSKITEPLNIGSPAQLAELFYDILKLAPVDKKKPRGTGEEILTKLNHPLCKPILDYREVNKLITTYIDKMPDIRNKKTGRIHCNFNQYGADCVEYNTIVPNIEFPGKTIGEICENNIPNMQSGILHPFKITIFNKYGELEHTSHAIKFEHERAIRLLFEDNSDIIGTYKHPILMKDNLFCELQYINIGDECASVEKGNLKVIDKQFLDDVTVYDFKVPQTHSFVSNNIISHNTGRFSCISAGTMISMPGGDKKIEDVQSGDWVYCYDDFGKLKLSKVRSCMFTGNKQCVKLHWVSKYNRKLKGDLICTPEHRIKTTNGWIMAKDLCVKDSIYHVHRKECGDYVRLSGQFGQGAEEEHVWIKKNYFDCFTDHLHIHHKDKNRLNNSPDNLVICTPREHSAIHRAMKDGYCGAYDYTVDELYAKCEAVGWDISKVDHDYWTLKGWLKQHRINYILKYTQSYNTRPTTIRSNGKSFKYKSLPMTKENCKYALDLANFDIELAASYFGDNAYKFKDACSRYSILDNHNVYSIEYLYDAYPVYDLEIEGYHNFIANELCVHNSSDPNLQNIPSHNKEIRRLFCASKDIVIKSRNLELVVYPYDFLCGKYAQEINIGDKLNNANVTQIQNLSNIIKIMLDKDIEVKIIRPYILIGADYSQQEPKLTADLSGDEKFIAECAAGKDAYGTVASLAFNKPYEDCLEFYADGSLNKEGKERRSQAKSILLGICYGRSIKTIAEQLGCEESKAQQIYDSVINGIAGLKKLTEESEEMARVNGWVETKWGRRRHIPDMQLPPYTISTVGTKNFDPFFDSEELGVLDDTERLKQKYLNEIYKAKWYKEKKAIKERAEKDGLHIHDNTRFIDEAKRQCVNSRIQGSAADQTKIAIQNLYINKRLRELGWRTLLLVHDEIIGECPLIFAKECGQLLSQCMIDAAKDLRTGAKCDATYVFRWYDDQFKEDVPVEKMSQQEIEELVVKCIKGAINE